MAFSIIVAKSEHAAEIVAVMRASIIELCADDHENQHQPLAEWLENKTTDNMLSKIADPEIHIVITMKQNTIVGVGGMNKTGRILWNYIAPDFRFLGISKMIMTALETKAIELGIKNLSLESSKTALRFYQATGWHLINENAETLEMTKNL